MIYKDPKFGLINLSSDELPKPHKRTLLLLNILSLGIIAYGVYLFILSLTHGEFFIGLLGLAALAAIALICQWLKKLVVKNYKKARAEILKKAERGEIDLFDIDKFNGIVINNIEVGSNLLGWVRGVDQTSEITPVSARFTFTNKTGHEIKYITFCIRPYNSVGDPVECTVRKISLYNCKCTGPFAANGKFTQVLENAWYNTTIECAKIESAEIVYMDGRTETLSLDQIKILSKNSYMSDNDARVVRSSFGQLLMTIALVIDVISIIGIFAISAEVFSVLTAISTIAFIIGLKMKP